MPHHWSAIARASAPTLPAVVLSRSDVAKTSSPKPLTVPALVCVPPNPRVYTIRTLILRVTGGGACTPQGLNNAFVGNSDIYNTIDTSVDLFGSTGKVGSLGEMTCQSISGMGLNQGIRWGIFHT